MRDSADEMKLKMRSHSEARPDLIVPFPPSYRKQKHGWSKAVTFIIVPLSGDAAAHLAVRFLFPQSSICRFEATNRCHTLS